MGLTSPLPSARRLNSPTPTTQRTSAVQGRTSDGRYGLNHYPPQRDVHNGPQQAFLESSLATMSRPETWEQWSDARAKFFADCGPLAQDVYTFACVDETIVTVSPSSPALPGSRNSPSTPFRRSPRPDYEAMLAELQSKYVKVGSSSYLHVEKAMLVHVWRVTAAANRFVQCWHRCWQVLFEHRVRGIHVPLSAVFDIQGTTISVTALPPVYVDRVPPLKNIFGPLLRGEIDIYRRAAPTPIVGNSTVDYMLTRFFAALHLPPDESCLEEFGDCSLFHGIDGRLYLLEIGPMLCHTTPLLRDVSAAGPCCPAVRHELLRQFALDRSSGATYCNSDLHRYILKTAIPRAVESAVALLPQGTPESRAPEVLLRDSFLGMMCHDHGVNISYMHALHLYCAQQAEHAADSSQSKQQHEDSRPFYALLAQTALMEMLARTIKGLVRLDLTGGFTTTADRKTSTQVRIDMINRAARLVASRDQDFLQNHVLPALRAKFGAPESFVLAWDVMPVGAMLKVLSVQFGCEYGVHEGRFHAFTPFASKVALMFYPLVTIDAMLAADEKRTHDGALQLWCDANRSISRAADMPLVAVAGAAANDTRIFSVFHLTFLVRALAFTTVTSTHRAKVQAMLDTVDSAASKCSLTPLALADLIEPLCLHESRADAKRYDRLQQFSQLIVDELFGARESSSSAADDVQSPSSPLNDERSSRIIARCGVPQLSTRLIHAAMQFPAPQSGLLRNAFTAFLHVSHVDFVFSALHSQALREVEGRLDAMDEQATTEFLRTLVEEVVSSLRRWNRLSNAARYLQRLTSAMISARRMENVTAAGRVAQLSFSVQSTLFGASDARTLQALYILCIFSLSSFRSSKTPVVHAIHNLRKVLDKHNSLSSALQQSFGRTAPVLGLLGKVRGILEELGDTVAVASLKTALHHAQMFTQAVALLQATGRGYMARRSKRSTSHHGSTVSRTLGIGGNNLGVSLDNDEEASDCSTLTGSFIGSPLSSSTHSSCAPRQRFVPRADRPVPLDAALKGKLPNVPDPMYSPSAAPPPPYAAHSNAGASSMSYLYMPPRPAAVGPPPPPQLPPGQIPAGMIARTIMLQKDGDATPGMSSASSSSDTPNKPQPAGASSRRGIMDAWGSAPVPPPPPPPETHVVHLLPSPTSGGEAMRTTLSHSAQDGAGQISNATLQLFERCDKDHDGVVTVDDCLEHLASYKALPRDELREVLLSCSTKVKQPGTLSLLLGRTRDVLPIENFSKAIRRAGIAV